MKTLICQLWSTSPSDKPVHHPSDKPIQHVSYSLHLNEQHRLRFLNKNIKNYRDVNVKVHYQCDVEDDAYEQVIKHQSKHGLMFEGSPPENKRRRGHLPLNYDISDMKKFLKEMKDVLKIKEEDIEDIEETTNIKKVTVTVTKPKEGNYIELDAILGKHSSYHPIQRGSRKYRRVVDHWKFPGFNDDSEIDNPETSD